MHRWDDEDRWDDDRDEDLDRWDEFRLPPATSSLAFVAVFLSLSGIVYILVVILLATAGIATTREAGRIAGAVLWLFWLAALTALILAIVDCSLGHRRKGLSIAAIVVSSLVLLSPLFALLLARLLGAR